MSIYDYKVKTISGEETTLTPFRGKTLLIVNVASECGFTVQYEGLEKLYQKYKDKGLVVLGFPCNQFGGQESGDESQIKSFCETKFHVTFPLFSKVDVNGAGASPLFEYLKKERKGFLGSGIIKWNFTKFLVGKDGEVMKRFAPQTTPDLIEKDLVF